MKFCLVFCPALMAIPAWGQDAVKMSDLAGTEIVAKVTHDQNFRRDGRDVAGKNERDLTVAIGSGDTLIFTFVQTVTTPRGRVQSQPLTGGFTLGQQGPSGAGGTGLWTFADGTLTYLRTFPHGGAIRSVFAFVRTADGITCTANETFGREKGGTLTVTSPVDGAKVTVLNSKQTASTCKVSKKVS